MNAKTKQQNKFEDTKINIKLKLAALWTSLMFLYIYVDYFHLYMPRSLADMAAATVYVPYTLFNLAGEAWVHMYFAATVEVALLLLIIRCALKWPRGTP